jgi:hypothetical protein
MTYGLQAPHGPIPLNPYGQAYKDAGRNQNALKAIENLDSDGDTYSNLVEIRALFFPGNNRDYPGLASAPAVMFTQERLLGMRAQKEFLLYNASKSQDFYASYSGVKISDLLREAGIRPEATQITVFAPDGFSKTFPINADDPQTPATIQYDVMGPYPHGYYYEGLNFVDYTYNPDYLFHGNMLPDKLYMLLGYLRDGDPLEKGRLVRDQKNPGVLTLQGEGPYRLVIPQKIAGGPDRPSTSSPIGDGWDYDANKDHNAGFSVRSVTAIRVEPLPAGTTDFNWIEGGWNLVDKGRVIVYGAINPHKYLLRGKISDKDGNPAADVKLSFGLASLGQVAETVTDSHGFFQVALPVGEYVIIPSKPGYSFYPESLSIHFSREGYRMEFIATPLS